MLHDPALMSASRNGPAQRQEGVPTATPRPPPEAMARRTHLLAPPGRIPHLLFVMFQCMFACITPALIIGAFAERMRFPSFLLFTALWTVFVYAPIAHMVWSSGGWLCRLGALDFAGGTVVHVSAGSPPS